MEREGVVYKRDIYRAVIVLFCVLILVYFGSLWGQDINAEERKGNDHRSAWPNKANPTEASAVSQEGERRLITYEDLLKLESFPFYIPALFSPSGGELVYVLQRPKEQAKFHNLWYMDGNDLSDIWLVLDGNKTAINITKGVEDGTGFWNPIWSPDGRYLAMYSTRGPEENIFLWAWEKSTGKLTLLSENGCDPKGPEPVWVSNSEIVFSVLPKGEIPYDYNVSNETPRIATREWAKNRYGLESTASVLESGLRVDFLQNPEGQLLHFNVATGEARELGKGRIHEILPSPDKKLVAGLILSSQMPIEENQRIQHACNDRYQIRVYDKNGVLSSEVLGNIKSVLPGTAKWSPDGNRLLFMGTYDENGRVVERRLKANPEAQDSNIFRFRRSQKVFIYDPLKDKIDDVLLKDIFLVEDQDIRFHLSWTPGNQVIVYASSFSEGSDTDSDRQRSDWWVLKRDYRPVCLTKKLKSPSPVHLYPEKDRNSWVILDDGNIWRIKGEGHQVINITKDKDKRISSIIWVDSRNANGISKLIYQITSEPGKSELCFLDLDSGKIDTLAKPTENAEFIAFSSLSSRAVFIDVSTEGTYLWLTDPTKGWIDVVVETNTFLRNIKEAKTIRIDYTSLDGEPLIGWILLPADYEKGQRYPLITHVYPGWMQDPYAPGDHTQLYYNSSLNTQWLAAHGYAVLFPSIPKSMGSYLDLSKGVLPAIDKAAELGIADRGRLAVMGHSAGGFATFGLITQTDLFQAAIALAGPYDLISYYLQFEGRKRYGKNPLYPRFYPLGFVENFIEGHMPPWRNAQAYIRNSPIFYADRVNTPVLIVHADIDGVSIGQSEEIYTALYRQGKRARFIRYWGDDHLIVNPANVRHMWGQILIWLKENGCPPNK